MSKQAVAGPDILLFGGRAISKTRCGEYLLFEDRIFGAKMSEFVRRSCSRISISTQR